MVEVIELQLCARTRVARISMMGEQHMLTHHVALVSEESAIPPAELMAVAAALEKQVTRDFAPIWKVPATVTAFQSLDHLPLDYWPIIIKDDIGDPSAAGYHEDQNGQPFALVQYSDGWPLTVSHELLEMLADPFGRRMVAGPSPKPGQGRVKFLVEVCDPCESEAFSYSVNDIKVSDFYTPQFFDPVTAAGVRYSFTGSIKQPRQVLRDGYLSWYDPASASWWQRTWFGGAKAADKKLALKVVGGNIRAAIDRHTEVMRAKAQKRLAAGTAPKGTVAEFAAPASLAEGAESLRAAVKSVIRRAKR